MPKYHVNVGSLNGGKHEIHRGNLDCGPCEDSRAYFNSPAQKRLVFGKALYILFYECDVVPPKVSCNHYVSACGTCLAKWS